ncbi:uncharacterized protein HMPREF1541_02074 [Cyphellophora europaea CBS 101466]|uniref:Uncharacterized protein n=1 Tax=Cyphellophora europaea (strain CBS 101466) TaxID=1220924 RepID=W2S2J2_CYPE1|nr:uncharacterized protein HMPREF1541_02074 [Cyphellophora europaea CBS 101466]ETN42916.1 hypothetical protein HMPREF1541_02074 [Cyphellophora europaea CBS 101466]
MSITETLETTKGRQSESSHHLTVEDDAPISTLQHESLKHPLGVRPSGNALIDGQNGLSATSAMGSFGMLPDGLMLSMLEYLEARSLAMLGSTCRALFAYCSFDQLWRDLAVEAQADVPWPGSWRSCQRKLPDAKLPSIDCQMLYSDALHRPFLCSQIDLNPYASTIPVSNTLPRLRDLSTVEFNQKWTGKPFILTEPVKHWKVYREWSLEQLRATYSDTTFRAEAVDWPMERYLAYMSTTRDESPLYLFDRAFVEKMDLSVGPDGDYEPPSCFQEDLFSILDKQRPDHRWLIIGPARSGSTFHKDPNATSAWNAVVRGSKYWIMFPPSVLPPGVYMSEDQSEVTSPLSIAEWLFTFHAEARETPGCLEGVCREGEVLHVPSGWWHLVVNLVPAIAITQNFVPRSHLKSVVNFLDRKRDQVSGFRDDVTDAAALFRERLGLHYPELAKELDSISRKRKWEEVVAAKDAEESGSCGFSFGFGDDIDSDS